MQKSLAAINRNYVLSHPGCDAQGRFESITLISPEDLRRLGHLFHQRPGSDRADRGPGRGPEESIEPGQLATLKRLRRYDGRFDVLHFEQITDLPNNETEEEVEEPDELLDPGVLLAVLGELAKLTGGVAVDPQSGTLLAGEEWTSRNPV